MEFGEYENEDCAKANEVVKQVLQDYEGKVKFNFRHFPLTRIHQRSMKAAEAAVAAVAAAVAAISTAVATAAYDSTGAYGSAAAC
jgi:protein-disulfide isomerase